MRISIGILAWNESATIAKTLASLFEQSLLDAPPETVEAIEVICVPNGCTDDTPCIARKTMEACARASADFNIAHRVEAIETPGKANAWNVFVHQCSDPEADYVFLLDADIWFQTQDTLWNMVEALEHAPEAVVSTDTPVKDIQFKPNRSLVERASLGITALNESGDPLLCGQLYCARGPVLREIWMPVGLLSEDGFLGEMIRTDQLTRPKAPARITRARNASHVFEAYTTFTAIFRHHRQIVASAIIVALLCEDLKEHRGALTCGELIRQRNEADPAWLGRFINGSMNVDRRGVIPIPVLSRRRFQALYNASLVRWLVLFPFALAGTLLDAVTVLAAHRWLKKSGGTMAWEKLRTN